MIRRFKRIGKCASQNHHGFLCAAFVFLCAFVVSVWGRSFTTKTQRATEFTQRRMHGSRVAWLCVVGMVMGMTLTILSSRASSRMTAPHELTPNEQQMQFPEGLDYSKFLHSNANHSRLPCLLCHRRESNAAIPTRPGNSGHLPCAGCHAQQFAQSDGPICTICHTDAKSGALKPFPRLRSFNMKFDHARHLNMGSVACATCHRPARGGVALSIPSGFNAHST